MGDLTSISTMRSLLAPQPAEQAEGTASLLSTFQAHVEDMRNLVLCKICIRPLYEPYTLGCGHTYCYSCLTSWFGGAPNRRKRKNCPDCRTSVTVQPSPNYLLRDLVHMFISRVELLPEDETTAEHDEAKRIEAQLIETDRTTRTDGASGLFKGVFGQAQLQYHGPIHDVEDGVMRCPMCAWEMEDGECGQCGYAEPGFSDGDSFDTINSPSALSAESSTMDADDENPDYHDPVQYPFTEGPRHLMRQNRREWGIRDHSGPRARVTTRDNVAAVQAVRGSPVDTDNSHSELEHHYHDHMSSGIDSEDDDEMPHFQEQGQNSYNDPHWNEDTTGGMNEDEEMTSADEASTTSFHRAAILARDRGLNPPFASDISSHGDGETVTNASQTSDESSDDSEDDSTPEPARTIQRLASRPARIVIDSDETSGDDSTTSGEDEDVPTPVLNGGANRPTQLSSSSDEDTTPSPPMSAAARHARVQMHRGRRGVGDRSRGRGRGRGRPRTRS